MSKEDKGTINCVVWEEGALTLGNSKRLPIFPVALDFVFGLFDPLIFYGNR